MTIADLEMKFADELASIRRTKTPRARKYSLHLKKAILDLNASGISLDDIRAGLGFSGGTFKNWAAQVAGKQAKKADFAALKVEAPGKTTVPRPGTVVIELPSGVNVRVFY